MDTHQNMHITSQEVVESSEVAVHNNMQGMQVLGEAVTQQEFLADHVIFQELSGSKALAEMQAHLRDLTESHQQVLIPQNLVSSLSQTIQSEHAYPICQAEDTEDHEDNGDTSDTAEYKRIEDRKKERVLSLLEDIESFIIRTYPDVLTILMEDPDENPFLSVSSKYPDKFLHDQSSLRLNIQQGSENCLSCMLLTYNREVIRQTDIKNINTDVSIIIEDMIGDRYQYCRGLTFKDEENFCSKIKKSDIQHLLIEKYNGKVFYRSKDCKFIVDNNTNSLNANSESRNHCPECRIFTSTIVDRFANKSLDDFVVPDHEVELEDYGNKRKRGRPKGSRKRMREDISDSKEETYGPGNSMFESLAELRVGDVDTNLGTNPIIDYQIESSLVKNESNHIMNDEIDDIAMEDNPSDDDYDINTSQLPKRGKRKKMLSKKLLEHRSEDVSKSNQRKISKTSPLHCSEEGCQESFSTVGSFKTHLEEHSGTFVCSQDKCIKRFDAKEDVINHEKKHRGEKPFSCSECKKEYATKQDLKLHFRKHTGEKPYQCNMCEKKFAIAQQLKVHKAVHTGEKNYLCSDCGNSYGSQSTLIDHRKRKHLKHFPHKCSHCGRGFFTRQELEAHVRTHTGDKPYVCQLCKKGFARAHHVKRHMNTVHSEKKQMKLDFMDETEIEETETHLEISEDGLLIKTMTTEEAGEVFTKPVPAVMVTQSSSSTATPTFTAKRIVLPKMVSMDELL